MKTLSRQKFLKLFNLLLFVTALTFATTWLPFIRAIMDGETYQWGTSFFGIMLSGKGISADFYYVIVNAVAGIVLLCSFYWIRNRTIFYGLSFIWFGTMIGNTFYHVFFGDGYEFHGDTLNIHLDLSYIIVPFMLALGIFVYYMIIQERKQQFKAKWNRKNRFWLTLLLLPIPFQVFLFSYGTPHGPTDKIGVVLALFQVFFVSLALKAYEFDSTLSASNDNEDQVHKLKD